MHREVTNLATKFGILDVCKEEKANRIENVLLSLTTKDLDCLYCKKHYASSAHLKNHIRQKHLRKTPYFCAPCKKYFTDGSSLRKHMAIHDPAAPKFTCPICQKVCTSHSKLVDHQQVHQAAKLYTCQFCLNKSYKRQRACREHESTCSANPAYNPANRHKCRLCGKDYQERRSLQRHFSTHHKGENIDG